MALGFIGICKEDIQGNNTCGNEMSSCSPDYKQCSSFYEAKNFMKNGMMLIKHQMWEKVHE